MNLGLNRSGGPGTQGWAIVTLYPDKECSVNLSSTFSLCCKMEVIQGQAQAFYDAWQDTEGNENE